jgi:hypothetical protein
MLRCNLGAMEMAMRETDCRPGQEEADKHFPDVIRYPINVLRCRTEVDSQGRKTRQIGESVYLAVARHIYPPAIHSVLATLSDAATWLTPIPE